MPPDNSLGLAPLPEGPFSGPEAFATLVRGALEGAAARGWTELVLCDTDFDGWPLGERAVCTALNAWAARGHRLALLARSFAVVERRHARLVQLRRQWAHKVECREASRENAGRLPSGIWTPEWVLVHTDPERWSGVTSAAARRRVSWRETLDAAWEQGRPGFPATTLGL